MLTFQALALRQSELGYKISLQLSNAIFRAFYKWIKMEKKRSKNEYDVNLLLFLSVVLLSFYNSQSVLHSSNQLKQTLLNPN